MEQSASQRKDMLQTALKQDMTQELATYDQMETALSSGICIDTTMKGLENGAIRTYEKVAPTLTSREYRGPRMILEELNESNRKYIH